MSLWVNHNLGLQRVQLADSVPPTPIDSVAPESYYWDDMLLLKKFNLQIFLW